MNMKKRKKYKYGYNTYQKNAILLIAFLTLAGGIVGYYNYLNYSPDDEYENDSLPVQKEKIKDRSIKDINAELDNLLQQDAPRTYKDRQYTKYDADYQKYLKEKEQEQRDREEYKIRAQMEQEQRIRIQQQKIKEEQERLRLQQEAQERERLRKQQQMLEDQRRREYEEQQRQLENLRRNENAARQNSENWSNTNFGQPQYNPNEMSEEEKAAERMRKEMERQQKLDEIKKKTYTPEQQEKIDECLRKEARKQSQLNRRRQAPIKSKHKYQNAPPPPGPETGGCEECAKY